MQVAAGVSGPKILQFLQVGTTNEASIAGRRQDREAKLIVVFQRKKGVPQFLDNMARQAIRLGGVLDGHTNIRATCMLHDLRRDVSFAHQPWPWPFTGMTTPFTQLAFSETSIAVIVAHSSGVPGRPVFRVLYISL